MTEDISTNSVKQVIPFFIRAIAILILVTGILGLIFYSIVTFYQITGRNFLYDFEYKNFDKQGLYFILFLYIALNSGLVISGLQLIKLKRAGMYTFGISYLVFALLGFFLQDNQGWAIPIIGFIIFLVIFIHKRKLIN